MVELGQDEIKIEIVVPPRSSSLFVTAKISIFGIEPHYQVVVGLLKVPPSPTANAIHPLTL